MKTRLALGSAALLAAASFHAAAQHVIRLGQEKWTISWLMLQ